MIKVYISGPITGLSEDEYTTNFGMAEAMLLGMDDYDPVNPLNTQPCATEDCRTPDTVVGGQSITKSDGTYLHSWQCYMKHDLIDMLECSAILMIPGWESSKGATLELDIAVKVGMTVFVTENYKSMRGA